MRNCGGCTLCCTVLSVPGVTEVGEPCEHLTRRGCGIYADRPEYCRTYNCSWLLGAAGGTSVRPDRCGGVLGSMPDGTNAIFLKRLDDWKRSAWLRRKVAECPVIHIVAGVDRVTLRK